MENATLRFICLVLFLLIFGLFKETLQFLQQINVKNDHLVFGAGIRTLNLLLVLICLHLLSGVH